MLRRRAGYRGLILSFEPNPQAAAIATDRAARDGRWLVFQLAIAEENGEAELNVMRNSEFSSLSRPRNIGIDYVDNANSVANSIKVRAETLASAFKRLGKEYGFRRAFLKLDTQGFDVRIVKASQTVINEFVGLQSELAVEKLYKDSVDFREAITVYESFGFSLSALVPNNDGHFPRLLEIDCIMARTDLIKSSTPS